MEGTAGTAETETRSIHLKFRGRRGVEALLVAIGDIKGVTHSEMLQAVGPNSFANEAGVRPARTRSTICRLNSGVYRIALSAIVNSSVPNVEVSTETGQLHTGFSRKQSLTIAIGRLRCASACRPAWHQPQDLFAQAPDDRRLAGQPRGASRRTQSIQSGLLQSPWTHRTRSVEPLIDEFALDRLVRELPSGAPTPVRSKSRLLAPSP